MSLRSVIKKRVAEVKADARPEIKIKELQLELGRLRTEHEKLKFDNTSLRQKLQLKESTITTINDLNINLESELVSLRAEFSNVESSLIESVETLQKMQERVKSL